MKGELEGCQFQLADMVEKYPDATLSEYCEYWGEAQGLWISPSTMCRALQKVQLTRKKRRFAALKPPQSESKSYGVSTGLHVKKIEPENLVFLDETGILLGLARTHARSPQGSRVYELKPFYRGAFIECHRRD